ncbi:SNF2-related domain-containing protein [Tieghemostelium lacteum]|uniref:SNF2-related domain-containing protein n=1 Tax=Tieghemostelium lacteum TaxID=361077 RepID=A0A151ZAY3_TIELA|nr:SNF2-related domain-containing protein [Tieghemostelium lacteum]|eukprot:KYQ91107.1 SNF2-related domain-containing protein [Tieghemostelium lacteum]
MNSIIQGAITVLSFIAVSFGYAGAFIISRLFTLFCILVDYPIVSDSSKLVNITDSIQDLSDQIMEINDIVHRILETNEQRNNLPLSVQPKNNHNVPTLVIATIEKAQSDRIEKEMGGIEEQVRLEKEKVDKAEADRIAKERAEADKIAKEKAEMERLEKIEADRIAKERAEKKEKIRKIAKEKAERKANEKADRIAKKKAEKKEKQTIAKLEAERIAKEIEDKNEKERMVKMEAERIAFEKAEKEAMVRQEQERESGLVKLVHLTLERPKQKGKKMPLKRISQHPGIVRGYINPSKASEEGAQVTSTIPIPPPLPQLKLKKVTITPTKKSTPQPPQDPILSKWREDIKKIHNQTPDIPINQNNINKKINKNINTNIKNQLKILEEYLPIPMNCGASRIPSPNSNTTTTTTTTTATTTTTTTTTSTQAVPRVPTVVPQPRTVTAEASARVQPSSIDSDDIRMEPAHINNNLTTQSIKKLKTLITKTKTLLNRTGMNERMESRFSSTHEFQRENIRKGWCLKKEISNSFYKTQQLQLKNIITSNSIQQNNNQPTPLQLLLDNLTKQKDTLLSNLQIDQQDADDEYLINFTLPLEMKNSLIQLYHQGLLKDKYQVVRNSTPREEFSNCLLSVMVNDEVYKLIDFNHESIVVLYQEGADDNDIKIGVVFNHSIAPFDSINNDD